MAIHSSSLFDDSSWQAARVEQVPRLATRCFVTSGNGKFLILAWPYCGRLYRVFPVLIDSRPPHLDRQLGNLFHDRPEAAGRSHLDRLPKLCWY